MNQSAAHKKFIFNEKLDSGFLYSLYEDDYPYITQVFSDTIEELENSLMSFAMAFNGGEVGGLKLAAHKIKPLFGFTGLLSVQDAVSHFESHCGEVSQVGVLTDEYNLLMENIDKSKQLLITEQIRLQEYSGK
ncbi:MAG: hypothetical protein H0X41_14290 [Chitinophagaceae bacterium]|nr:hypothetical protein [Chitinophagaceae bacterium]